MKKQVIATIAGAVALACLGSQALAQSRDLNVVSWGGAYQDGQKEVFFKPFNATGTKQDKGWQQHLGRRSG